MPITCRNRNCPKCQATARAKWLADREAELLPVAYFHVVFTLPQQIGRLALQNPRQIYTILFQYLNPDRTEYNYLVLKMSLQIEQAQPRQTRRFEQSPV
jgi:hypothetical protein